MSLKKEEQTQLSDKEGVMWLDLRFEDRVMAKLDMKLIFSH